MTASGSKENSGYRGRLAPSPTGHLHLGHARTFWMAQQRALDHGGALILRNEDLDAARSKPEFVTAMIEDLQWFEFHWQEGPDCGGPLGPYNQSERFSLYRDAFQKLIDSGAVYPCACSRKDIQSSASAPHASDNEPVYPGICRPRASSKLTPASSNSVLSYPQAAVNWRLLVPDGEIISFVDGHFGPQQFVAGKDFGDFIIWRHDGVPSYQLAVAVDDAAMQITEVVRGADLLLSTARQILLYRALGLIPPLFYHCPLMCDKSGARLAKRHDALSLRALRAQGISPELLRRDWSDA